MLRDVNATPPTQNLQAPTPAGSSHTGRQADALGEAWLTSGMAHLALDGATIDVTRPLPLIPGTLVSIALGDAEGTGGQRLQPRAEPSLPRPEASGASKADEARTTDAAPRLQPGTALHTALVAVRLDALRAVAAEPHSPLLPIDTSGQGPGPAAPHAAPPAGGLPYPTWMLPHAPPHDLTILHEQAGKPSDGTTEGFSPTAAVQLTMESGEFGFLHTKVSLKDGRVSVRLWAESSDGATRLQQAAGALRTTLQDAALDIETIEVRSGRPPEDADAKAIVRLTAI